jgi:ribosomal protein S11
MKYKKAFGWGQSGTNPLKWLTGEGDDSKAADRIAFLEKKVKDLEGVTEATLRSKVATLEAEAYDAREKMRSLSEQAAKAKGIDALNAELEAYRAFGKPEELKVNLEKATADAAEVVKSRREKSVMKAAEISTLEIDVNGKKEARPMNAKTLAELAELKGWDIEIGTTKIMGKDGKLEEVPAAFVKGSDGKPVALAEHVRATAASFVTSLVEEASTKVNGTPVVLQPRGEQPPAAALTVEARAKEKQAEYGSSL